MVQVRDYGDGGADAVLNLRVVKGPRPMDAYEWVKKWAEKGEALSASIDQQLNQPYGIATVPAHKHLIVVTASNSHQVRVYDTMGGSSRLVYKIGKEDESSGDGEGEFNKPWGVVVTPDSALVIVSDSGGNRLQVFSLTVDADGKTAVLDFTQEIGKLRMLEPKGLTEPKGLVLRRVGHRQTVLVAEMAGVSEWGLDGIWVRTIRTDKVPYDVAVLPASGQIAIADTYKRKNSICIYNGKSGAFSHAFGDWSPTKDGYFSHPCAIAADAHGHLLVLDRTNRLQVLEANGTHLFTWRVFGGIVEDNSAKGLEWWGEGGGRLAIANGSGNNALVFDSG